MGKVDWLFTRKCRGRGEEKGKKGTGRGIALYPLA